ncbi:recombinase family protein [Brevundimonas sp. TWP2-3-4b2]|uniref:recombinase family protein n=1 Tax=Brevundimonas sp. TWP2-3-4b2 TaxID=2804595 RepID=UPI003CEA073F
MADGKFVAYYRVSTARQGQSGLGLEAQREAVERYLNGGSWSLIEAFTEIETGKGSNALARRPQLKAALAYARKHKATLVIAKLDRLSRSTAFLLSVVEGAGDEGVVFCDMPQIPPGPVGKFMVTQLAAVAELEAGMISERTKAALAAAKRRGVVLGANGRALAVRNRAEAVARVAPMAERLTALRGEGLSLRRIASTLNDEGVSSPGGGAWYPANVQRALGRVTQ